MSKLVAIRTVVVGADGATRANWMVTDESLVDYTIEILLQGKGVRSVQRSAEFVMLPAVFICQE